MSVSGSGSSCRAGSENENVDNVLGKNYINEIISSAGFERFGEVMNFLQEKTHRLLTRQEKDSISEILHNKRIQKADEDRKTDGLYGLLVSNVPGNIVLVSAFTEDYTIGRICERVNRQYALKMGYKFHCETLSLSAMKERIGDKQHFAWYKIKIMQRLLDDVQFMTANNVQHLVWVDADAIIINHQKSVEDLIIESKGKDLIIAEDMNTCCLLNSGLFILRATNWSRNFLHEVWNCDKYNGVTYFEQSTMVHCLRLSMEGFDQYRPFHSFLPGAFKGIKLFPHVAVLPTRTTNTNAGVLCTDMEEYKRFIFGGRELSVAELQFCESEVVRITDLPCYQATGNMCSLCQRTLGSNKVAHKTVKMNCGTRVGVPFLFHPAGMSDKMTLLHAAILKFGIAYDFSHDLEVTRGGHEGGADVTKVIFTEPFKMSRGRIEKVRSSPKENEKLSDSPIN